MTPCAQVADMMKTQPLVDNAIRSGFKDYDKLSLFIEYSEIDHAQELLVGAALDETILNNLFARRSEFLSTKDLPIVKNVENMRGKYTSCFFHAAQDVGTKRSTPHTYGKILGWGMCIKAGITKQQKDKLTKKLKA